MEKPTEAQIRELWEWCGLCNHKWRESSSHQLDACCQKCCMTVSKVDIIKARLPDLDLNSLFGHAVPKLFNWNFGKCPNGYFFEVEDEMGRAYRETSYDPVLAAFLAIWKMIHHEGEEKMGKWKWWQKWAEYLRSRKAHHKRTPSRRGVFGG